jgi:hypothetical protein
MSAVDIGYYVENSRGFDIPEKVFIIQNKD